MAGYLIELSNRQLPVSDYTHIIYKHPPMTSTTCPAKLSPSYPKIYITYYYTPEDDVLKVLGPCLSNEIFFKDTLKKGLIKNLTRYSYDNREFYIAYIKPNIISEEQKSKILSPDIPNKYTPLDKFENMKQENLIIAKLIRKNLKELCKQYEQTKKIDIRNLINP